jgi:hypothetical protein
MSTISYAPTQVDKMRPLKKRYRMLPAGGLGVSPSFKKSPRTGGYRELIETISEVSK